MTLRRAPHQLTCADGLLLLADVRDSAAFLQNPSVHGRAARPAAAVRKGVRQVVFVIPFSSTLQDFVQNDPFLREPVIFMASAVSAVIPAMSSNADFPVARLTYVGPDGSVWRLD